MHLSVIAKIYLLTLPNALIAIKIKSEVFKDYCNGRCI
jgi:hypothetical protein